MNDNDYILVTKDLCKSYGKSQVLKNLNIKVPKGSIYGFIGKNGAGKTTLIRLVTGLQYPSSGEIIMNCDRRKIGAIVETPALHLNLSASDNLNLQMDILGLGHEKTDELLDFVGLSETQNKHVANFSLGMRQRLAIAVALCGEPEFLVLDEPINGLDPQGIIDVRNLITEINRIKGITILISSHILEELSKVATHYGFIDNGRIIAEMSAEKLKKISEKSMLLTLSKINNTDEAMKKFNNRYEFNDDSKLRIYGEINVTQLILALNEQNIEVLNIVSKEENLEEYFFGLLGGDYNE